MSQQTVEVIIVGAGMVGLTLAVALKQAGISVIILDKGRTENIDESSIIGREFSPRVSAISLASQTLFENLGVWASIVRKAPYSHMHVWEDQGFGHIDFSAQESNTSQLGHIIENDVLCSALFNQAKQLDIPLITQQEILSMERHEQTQSVTAELSSGDVICAQLIVGADGAQSQVRQQFQFPMTFWDYDHLALVGNIRTQHPHGNTARQAFAAQGPLALLPLADPHQCSIVWSQTTQQAHDLLALDERTFCKALQVASDNLLGRVELVAPLAHFPLKMQYARQWCANGIALVGDAAHTIHPLAGQGANLGLLDAAALVEQLSELKAHDKSFYPHKHLRPYERWRKTDAAKVVATMEGFKQLFAGNDPLKKLTRNIGLSASNSIKPVKQFFIQQATGGSGRLPRLVK